jgi:hypothetical protein
MADCAQQLIRIAEHELDQQGEERKRRRHVFPG